jgi:trimeric autotransporter adhesin
MMPGSKLKTQFITALATLSLLALMAGCKGFFVNPTLTSLAIGPSSPTITKSQTQQMAATGTYDDGSTKDLTGRVTWTTSDSDCATINANGLVTPSELVANICTTTIGASFGTVSASSVTVTVTPGTPTSINLKVDKPTPGPSDIVTFTAEATFPGVSTPQDVTTSVTWINSDTTELTLNNGSGTGTISASATPGNTINVTARFSGVDSNTVTLTITQ